MVRLLVAQEDSKKIKMNDGDIELSPVGLDFLESVWVDDQRSMISVHDHFGTFLGVSWNSEEVYGVSPERLIGTHAYEWIREELESVMKHHAIGVVKGENLTSVRFKAHNDRVYESVTVIDGDYLVVHTEEIDND